MSDASLIEDIITTKNTRTILHQLFIDVFTHVSVEHIEAELQYKPTGWLGLLLAASFYIGFTKNDFA